MFCNKFLSGRDNGSEITLDTLVKENIDFIKMDIEGAVVMNKDKIEELIAASKLNELLHKKDVEESKKKSNVIIIVLAVIGAVAALAAIVYAIYRYFTPDYLDDFDDDFDDDDFDEDFEDDDEFEN